MTPDKLPEEITEQLKIDSETYAGVMVWINQNPKGEEQLFYEYISATSYIAGATAWAGWKVQYDNLQAVYTGLFNTAQGSAAKYQELQAQAQRMADTLDKCVQFNKGDYAGKYLNVLFNECEEALQQFKDGKGKEATPTEQEIEAEVTRRWNSIGYNPIGTRTRESYREGVIRDLTNPTK